MDVNAESISRNRGFTIIELLVVIAIIGLMASAILTGTASSRARGKLGAAMQTMKGVHDAAMICVNTNVSSYTFCLPGQNTLGCVASVTGDTQNGGEGFICASNPSGRYVQLPAGYIYCNSSSGAQSASNCGNEVSNLTVPPFRIRAESHTDGYVITCVESGCSSIQESPPN
jgi:prepilin-type N-terminal cleavage/methylation domain-containing protein